MKYVIVDCSFLIKVPDDVAKSLTNDVNNLNILCTEEQHMMICHKEFIDKNDNTKYEWNPVIVEGFSMLEFYFLEQELVVHEGGGQTTPRKSPKLTIVNKEEKNEN